MNGGVSVMFLALAVLVASSQVAMADTTKLVCNLDSPAPFAEDQPTTIDLTEAQSSVVVHFGPTHATNPGITGGFEGRGGNGPFSNGPLPAVFSTDTITFAYPIPNTTYVIDYVINRLTGVFTSSQGAKWTCRAGKTQF